MKKYECNKIQTISTEHSNSRFPEEDLGKYAAFWITLSYICSCGTYIVWLCVFCKVDPHFCQMKMKSDFALATIMVLCHEAKAPLWAARQWYTFWQIYVNPQEVLYNLKEVIFLGSRLYCVLFSTFNQWFQLPSSNT